ELKARVGKLDFSPPASLFPSQWLKKADLPRLEKWLLDTEKECLSVCEAELGFDSDSSAKPPDLSRMKAAGDRLALTLNRALSGGELFRAVAGEEEAPEPTLVMTHLNTLLPPLKPPPVPGTWLAPRASAVALFSAIGAVLGDLAGGALLSRLGQPAETGILLGAAAGAALGAAAALILSQNEKLRKRLLLLVGATAAVDAAVRVAKGAVLPGFSGGGSGSFAKRLGLYLALTLALFLVKAKPDFDREGWRANLESTVDLYLRGVIPLAAVLMFRLGEKTEPSDAGGELKLLEDLVPLVKRLKGNPEVDGLAAFSQLTRKMENAGFDLTLKNKGTAPESLVWDGSLSDSYDTFGRVKNGQRVIVEEEPLIKDGEVLKKGLVALE
ncbi:MAG: hypothetical protein LBF41_01200, partial [Deltaproteobacteria bacterium]|nr:hypothetical protein [Deltaproteobacteria bacterium]